MCRRNKTRWPYTGLTPRGQSCTHELCIVRSEKGSNWAHSSRWQRRKSPQSTSCATTTRKNCLRGLSTRSRWLQTPWEKHMSASAGYGTTQVRTTKKMSHTVLLFLQSFCLNEMTKNMHLLQKQIHVFSACMSCAWCKQLRIRPFQRNTSSGDTPNARTSSQHSTEMIWGQ